MSIGVFACLGLAGVILINQDDAAWACRNPKYAWLLTLVSTGVIIFTAISFLKSN
jgi:hypothetical protein